MKDESKTRKQLIEELEAERKKTAGVDLSGVERQLAGERVRQAIWRMADDGALSPNSVISEPLANFVPVLSVTNLEQSLRYYTEGLAYEEIDRWTESGHLRACRLRRDEVAVVLRQESSPLAHPDRRGQGVNIFHLCEDAFSFYREVTARGIRVSEPYVGNRMWVAGLTDPDGYRLSFESPTDVPEEKKLSDLETA